jgi:MoaA/NifB/PqqE/SkfB family radical SAM enzyme
MSVASVARVSARFVRHRFAELHPFEVQAVLTNACNLRCSYCRCPDLAGPTLSTGQWIAVIEDFARAGTIRIKYQGGEPTIRPDFGEICAVTRACGIVTAVVTNGIALVRCPALLDALDEVVVSLDSVVPDLHDRQRGAGTHALAVRAIDAARERGLNVFVNMVVTTETITEVEPMLAFCEQRHIGFNAQPAMFSRRFQDTAASHLALTPAQEQAFERQLAQWRRGGRPLMFAARTYEHAAAWPDYRQPTRRSDGPSRCMAGRFYVHVDANGDVFPCVLHDSPFTPMNLVTDGFEAAIRNAQRHECGDCFLPYLNERKALFALRPHAVLAWLQRG